MKKLKLVPEELTVESFESTDDPRGGKGTVRGEGWTNDPEACTCYGLYCGTSAPPGEPCVCKTASYEACSLLWS